LRVVLLVAAGATALLGSCASPTVEPPPPSESASGSSDAESTDVAGLFDVGDGRRMYLECRGTGSPLVVLVSGQRASAQDWMEVADGVAGPPVFEDVAKHTRVCAFDRPGTPVGEAFSRSDPAPMPTTAEAVVEDLHALLAAADVTEPFVLVAHSIGGLIGRLYASTYPDQVMGLGLIDATSIEMQDAYRPEEWPIQLELLAGDIREALVEYPDIERFDLDPTFDQVRNAPPIQPMPFTVISADHPWGPVVEQAVAAGALPPAVPADFGYRLDEVLLESRAAVAELLPNGVWIRDTDSGHNVHQEQPRIVADAIIELVDRVRAEG
jgi:pimeloyl-ACP methyl ester carboxylesterase